MQFVRSSCSVHNQGEVQDFDQYSSAIFCIIHYMYAQLFNGSATVLWDC